MLFCVVHYCYYLCFVVWGLLFVCLFVLCCVCVCVVVGLFCLSIVIVVDRFWFLWLFFVFLCSSSCCFCSFVVKFSFSVLSSTVCCCFHVVAPPCIFVFVFVLVVSFRIIHCLFVVCSLLFVLLFFVGVV